MKGFIFRLCVVILIIFTVFASQYADALRYRKDTFEPSNGDTMYDSMVLSEFAMISSKDGKKRLVIGGTVYPEDNRNAKKNVFFKLYDTDGTFIATSGINEMNCSLILCEIENTYYGFAIICEVRGDNESYGKVYEYTFDGDFINSISLKYSDTIPQNAGTEYGISVLNDKIYYTSIDSSKTTVLDSTGKYIKHLNHTLGTSVYDAVLADGVLYTAGSVDNEKKVPKAFINAYSLSNGSTLWSQKEFNTENDVLSVYSQIDDICIITEKDKPVSFVLYGKYFDASTYEKFLTNNKIELEEDIDTVSKKCIHKDFSLYRNALTAKDYKNSPQPSAFFVAGDITGNVTDIKKCETDLKKSFSSISFGSSSIERKENFSICTVSTSTVSRNTENLDTVIEGLDSTLKTNYKIFTEEPAKYKSFFTTAGSHKFFTYTSINPTDEYRVMSFNEKEYVSHIKNLKAATDEIYNTRDIINNLPVCIMASLLYILTRIRLIRKGIKIFHTDEIVNKIKSKIQNKIQLTKS